jgi:uncharacterized protein (TIGR02996 family)
VTDDHAAFLRAIIAEPDDDRPRLIFSDWLYEHGEPERSEFIRVQVELARADDSWTPPAGMSPANARDALRRRERELLDEYDHVWTPGAVYAATGYRGGSRPFSRPWAFRRGFVAEVACSWPDWLAHHAALLDACPIRHARDGLVRLPTDPTGYDLPSDRADWPAYLGCLFPGVRFEPPAEPGHAARRGRLLDEMRRDIARHLGIPASMLREPTP